MSLKERVQEILGSDLIDLTEFRSDICVEIPKGRLVHVLSRLREDGGFDFLSDIVGIDNLHLYEKKKQKKAKKGQEEESEPERQGPPPPRFEVVYLLLSLKTNERLQVRVRVPEEDMELPTITTVWRAANWPEREVFDMFGIRFKGHPNLRRLLMWDEFQGHPLRKDYPLEGKGEERHLNYDVV